MRNLKAHARLAPDSQRLLDRFQQIFPLTAHVRGVNSIAPGGHARQVGKFLGCGKEARRIN
ncbi:MAG: hypothetical protein L6437_14555, partial [Kiritimatiellae bacterium]|nr:hypothetical protein [Kiritimatiellia bacterium]